MLRAEREAANVDHAGRRTWAALGAFDEGREYDPHMIERQLMRQDVVADAAALRRGLRENGHVEAPGIFFDFGKLPCDTISIARGLQ